LATVVHPESRIRGRKKIRMKVVKAR